MIATLVTPELGPSITGGSRYDQELLAALGPRRARRLDSHQAERELDQGYSGWLWVDSLCMKSLPGLRRRARGEARVGLLLHYLPSLVERGEAIGALDLTATERRALAAAGAFLVPSAFMQGLLLRLVGSERPILLVEPGCEARSAPSPAPAPGGVRAVMVSNLLPGKGIEPFLGCLARLLRADDRFELVVVGGSLGDGEYEAACRARVRAEPSLRTRITFTGSLPSDQALEQLYRCNLSISASRFESYGMALGEARRVGRPILARRGGNAATWVAKEAGGELLQNEEELAEACVALARDPAEHAARMQAALAHATPPRPWQEAAEELVLGQDQLKRLARAHPA